MRTPESNKKKLERKIKSFTIIAWSFLGIGGAVIVWTLVFSINWAELVSIDSYNALGDYWSGTVTTIWTLGSIFFIYVAFLGQRLQIILQSEELEDNRVEFRAQTEQLQAQTESFVQQQFESTFFNLLNAHHRMVEKMNYSNASGVECFQIWYKNFKGKYDLESGGVEDIGVIRNVHSRIEENIGHLTNHCYQNLFNIIEFVESNFSHDPDRFKFYIKILRAQLSTFELILFGYHYLVKLDRDDFSKLKSSEIFTDLERDKLLSINHERYFL